MLSVKTHTLRTQPLLWLIPIKPGLSGWALRASTVLAEDWGSAPSTHVAQFQGIQHHFLATMGTVPKWYAHINGVKVLVYIKKNKK